MSGRLISFEGGEGAGKSTVIAAAEAWLQGRGITVTRVREPGGTPIGERIRDVLLDRSLATMTAETELLLMFASRAQLVRETLSPALDAGHWVLADRFTDASFAYQGGARGLDPLWIAELERRTVGFKPHLTFLLDVPVEDGLARADARGDGDRIESEQLEFFERVRAVYLGRAVSEPERFVVVDAAASRERVAEAVMAGLEQLHGDAT